MKRVSHYAKVCNGTAAHIARIYGDTNLMWFRCWRRNGYSLRDALTRVRERHRLQRMAESLRSSPGTR